ncbi:MAG TPA: site-specific integrase [Thermomicrobiales bacterium]|nr:site-specific integrase [Thermomicrobiales bacterium]
MAGRRGHGEGSIYRRESDGKWCTAVDLGWVDGKRKRKVLYGETRKEVAEKLKVVLREHQQGLPVALGRQTVGQFLDRWLVDVAKPKLRPKTYHSYAELVRLHLKPALGHHQLAKLEPGHVQAMMNAKLEAGLSPRTVQYLRAVLRRALGQALKWGLVPRNVVTLTEPPRVTPPELQTLTPAQARAFLDAVRGDRLEALYAVALALGLRQGEALGLRWQDVDVDAGVLHVRVALQRLRGDGPRLVEPKTRRSRRSLPLPPAVATQLRAHRGRQREERLLAGREWQGDHWDLVFCTALGRPLDARHVVYAFKRHLRRAGLPDIRFHDLRHSCASLLLAQNVHPRVVMETLGHSTITLTMNTYAHVLPEAQRQAAALMDGLFGAATGAAD